MGSLTTSQLIKIILGIFVFIAVVVGAYLIFRDRIFDFFGGLPVGQPLGIIRSLL